MPAAKDNRKPGMDTLYGSSYFDGALDHGPGEHRNTDAQGIHGLTFDARPIIRFNGCVNYHNVKICLAQRGSQGEQAEGRTEWRSVIR